MTHTSSASRRPLERGQISWVSLLMLVAFVAGAYLAVVWVPVYVIHYEVQQTTRDYINQAVKNPNDEQLIINLCLRLAALDSTDEIGPTGKRVKVPTVNVEPRDITWERDRASTPPTLHVTYEYVRVVKYPWLDRSEERVMTVDLTEDMTVPTWGR